VFAVAIGFSGALLFASAATAQGTRAARAAEVVAMGDAFARSGDWGSAAGYYREALTIDASHTEAYAGLARSYRARGSLDDALETVRAGLRRRSHEPSLQLILCELLEVSGDRRAALAAASDLVRHHADHVAGWLRLARVAQSSGRFARALAAYRAVLRLTADPSVADGARRHVRALAILVGENDPVSAPPAPCSPIRHSLSGATCRRP
jgi:tetratricopeptide (TPR) repeat protein